MQRYDSKNILIEQCYIFLLSHINYTIKKQNVWGNGEEVF